MITIMGVTQRSRVRSLNADHEIVTDKPLQFHGVVKEPTDELDVRHDVLLNKLNMVNARMHPLGDLLHVQHPIADGCNHIMHQIRLQFAIPAVGACGVQQPVVHESFGIDPQSRHGLAVLLVNRVNVAARDDQDVSHSRPLWRRSRSG
jgi:hypothetical protein